MTITRQAFHLINTVGNIIPHRGRRFLLDRLGLGSVFQRASRNSSDEIVLPNGYKLFFNPVLHWNVTDPDHHEREVIAALDRYLKPGSVLYDIGANVGIYSLIAAKIVGPSGGVLAFEPGEINLKYLRQSLEQGVPNLTVHGIAIGRTDGAMTFDRKGGAMSGRLVEDGEKAVDPATVRVRSVDSLVAEGHPVPDVIKIDIEGGEGAALEGAAETLKSHPVVICEMHTFAPEGVQRATDALTRAGYRLTKLCERADSYHVVAVWK